tara:strand:+ start:1129 stop:2721 length:1593 start_codon:yes stop_codon:yes gene_type:complete
LKIYKTKELSNKIKIKKALISVYDKTNILDIAKFLITQNIEIYSSGGTYKYLKKNNINAIEISKYTKSPEILDGRVKTLHPRIHGGILAKRTNSKHLKELKENKINLIDLIIVNLYPFKKTVASKSSFKKCIENIDIGGPTLIRASAKNFENVTTITDPNNYQKIINEMKNNKNYISKKTRLELAIKAFNEISTYDIDISNWFSKIGNNKNENFFIQSRIEKKLRYGENPKQKASIYKNTSILNNKNSFFNMKIIQGKELSYNNINDMQAGCLLADEINNPCVVIIKHANPCGVSKNNNLLEAYKNAFKCDPVSAFGGIIIINGNIDNKLAIEISKTFVEIIVAKKISKEAKDIFQNKKNLIVIETKTFKQFKPLKEIKSMSDAFLIQTPDNFYSKINNLKFVTKKKLKSKEINDLLLAEKICKYVKSNAIVYVKNNCSIGIGAGQMNRLDSAKIGAEKAKKFFNKNVLKGSFIASDAFFPFPDSIDVFGKFKVKAIIQPGGSVKDEEVIKRANKYKIAMAFSNMRHFKH